MRHLPYILILLATSAAHASGHDWSGYTEATGHTWSGYTATSDQNHEPDRVVLFYARWSDESMKWKDKLDCIFDPAKTQMSRLGWKYGTSPSDHFQVVDVDRSRLDERFMIQSVPVLVKIEDGRMVREWTAGCGHKLDPWALGFLFKGVDERPKQPKQPITAETSGQYPLRANHWSVDGNWRPTRQQIINHLRYSGNHPVLATYPLESMSREELASAHSDDHEGRLRPLITEQASRQPKRPCPT